MIQAKKAREIAKVPAELDYLDGAIRRAADRGEPGVWTVASDHARSILKQNGYEADTTSKEYPGKVWIYWGN